MNAVTPTTLVRGIIGTTGATTISTFLQYSTGVLLIAYLTPQEYGLYTLAFMIPSVAVVLFDFGITQTAARHIAHYTGAQTYKEAEQCAGTLLVLRIGIAVISLFILLIVSESISTLLGENLCTALRIYAVFVFLQTVRMYLLAVQQGFFHIRERSISVVVYGVSYPFFVLILLYRNYGYLSPVIGICFSSLISLALSVYSLMRKHVRFSVDINRLPHYITFGAPLYSAVLCFRVYMWTGTALLKMFHLSAEHIGYYRAAFTLSNFILLAAVSLDIVFIPYFSQLKSSHPHRVPATFKKVVKYLFILTLPAAVGIYLVAEPVITLLFSEYTTSIPLLKIFSGFVVTVPFFRIINSFLTAGGTPMKVMYFSLLLASSNVVFVLILGSLFLLPGVALATILSISLVVAAQFYVIKRDFDLHFYSITFFKILFSTAALSVVVVVLSSLGDSILHLGLAICAGAGVYGVALILTGAVNKHDITLLRQLLNRS